MTEREREKKKKARREPLRATEGVREKEGTSRALARRRVYERKKARRDREALRAGEGERRETHRGTPRAPARR